MLENFTFNIKMTFFFQNYFDKYKYFKQTFFGIFLYKSSIHFKTATFVWTELCIIYCVKTSTTDGKSKSYVFVSPSINTKKFTIQ